MKNPLRTLGPLWRVQRQRHPRAAARVEATALLARVDLATEVHALRTRLAELERDHRLLAAHVATLTEQLDAATRLGPPDARTPRRDRLLRGAHRAPRAAGRPVRTRPTAQRPRGGWANSR
jgi:hypothetical protein